MSCDHATTAYNQNYSYHIHCNGFIYVKNFNVMSYDCASINHSQHMYSFDALHVLVCGTHLLHVQCTYMIRLLWHCTACDCFWWTRGHDSGGLFLFSLRTSMFTTYENMMKENTKSCFIDPVNVLKYYTRENIIL